MKHLYNPIFSTIKRAAQSHPLSSYFLFRSLLSLNLASFEGLLSLFFVKSLGFEIWPSVAKGKVDVFPFFSLNEVVAALNDFFPSLNLLSSTRYKNRMTTFNIFFGKDT